MKVRIEEGKFSKVGNSTHHFIQWVSALEWSGGKRGDLLCPKAIIVSDDLSETLAETLLSKDLVLKN